MAHSSSADGGSPDGGSPDTGSADTGSADSAESDPDDDDSPDGDDDSDGDENSNGDQGDVDEGDGDDGLPSVSRETEPASRQPAEIPPRSPGEADDEPAQPAKVAEPTDVAEPEGDTPDTPLAARIADEQRRRVVANRTAVPRPPAPRVMTIANQKGGVGKTTTTVNVAAALAQSGLNVLVVDIDPQGNASTALGIPHHAEVPSIYDVITDDRPLGEVLQECPDVPGLWCAPATIDLAGAEIELVALVARESRLKRAVEEHLATMSDDDRFDYVLIDCPPSLGLLTVNAFVAAAEVFIPIQCEYYALEGLSQLLKNIGMIRRHLNPRLEVSTILLTMYDGRTNLSSNVADEVRAHFPDNVLRTQIPRSVRISEAPSYGQTVLTYDPSSSGALSYLEAAKELALRSAPAAT
ncbi:ParA family protein [Branchiibius hedensis]|uniref:ParA family protein n=1 Tax=Branchiibius hedensis TaxID=672460 RepID=UPI00248316C0|nr:ParA family protein [Branchiibius hedensis]